MSVSNSLSYARARGGMAAVAIVTAMACGGDGFVATPTGPSLTTLPNGSMSAVVEGVPWQANLMVGGSGGAGFRYIVGRWSANQLPFSQRMQIVDFTVKASSVGTYSIADGAVVNMSFSDGPFPSPGGYPPHWSASLGEGGSGTVTFTVFSSSPPRFAGTFSFIAPARPGTSATGTRTITDGKFDITLQ